MNKKKRLTVANKWNQPLFAKGVDRENNHIFDVAGPMFTYNPYSFNSKGQWSINPTITSPIDIHDITGIPPVTVPPAGYKIPTPDSLPKLSKVPITQKTPFLKTAMGNQLLGMGAGIASNLLYNGISGNYSSDAGKVLNGATGMVGDVVSSFNPVAGALVKTIGATASGALNRLVGSSRNEEAIAKVTANTDKMNNNAKMLAKSTTTDDVLSASNNMTGKTGISSSDMVKNGIWGSDTLGDRKAAAEDLAFRNQAFGLALGSNKADRNLDNSAMVNSAAFGGPLLSKGHKFELGGEESNSMGLPVNGTSPDMSWHQNWLNSRANILGQNIADTKNNVNGKLQEWPGIYTMMGRKEVAKQIDNANKYKEYVGANGIPDPLYNHLRTTNPNIQADTNAQFYDKYMGNASGKTVTGPDTHVILYRNMLKGVTSGTHERTHAMGRNTPQIQKIESIMGDNSNILLPNRKVSPYLESPNEVYARLMAFRKAHSLDPKKVITKEDLDSWRKQGWGNSQSDHDIINRYTDDILLRLFNEVAENDIVPDEYLPDSIYTETITPEVNLGAFGGLLLANNKYDEGGNIPPIPQGPVNNTAPDMSWHDWWLNNRSATLGQNVLDTQRDWEKEKNAAFGVEELGKNEAARQIENANKFTEYVGSNLPESTYAQLHEYYPGKTDEQVYKNITKNAGAATLGHLGMTLYPEVPNMSVSTHERTHDLGGKQTLPQEWKVAEILDSNPKIYRKPAILRPASSFSDAYWDNPKEIYARLMAFRQEHNLDPTKEVTKDDLNNWRKAGWGKSEGAPFLLDRYKDDVLLRLFNEVADNNVPSDGYDINPAYIDTIAPEVNISGLGGTLDILTNNDMGSATTYGFLSDYLTQKNSKNNNTTSNMFAGYPKSFFAEGGSIKIKHPGRLTALKKRTGKTEAELWAEGNPDVRKMITFARNARKWQKAYGGLLGEPSNQYAIGGDLQTHGADWSTGARHIDAGSTHEENPNQGVQVGVAPDGKPNLVEEGEVIYNDYVYSQRIKLDEEAKAKFHFAKKADLSYADAAKKLEKEIEERPNDPISQAAFERQMADLAEEQERQKQEMDAQKAQEAFEALTPEEQIELMQYAQQQQGQEEAMSEEEAMAQEQAMAEQQAAQEQAMQQQGMMQQPMGIEQAMMAQQMPYGAPQEMGQPQLVQPETMMAYGGHLFSKGGKLQNWILGAMGFPNTREFAQWAIANGLEKYITNPNEELPDIDWKALWKDKQFADAVGEYRPYLKSFIGTNRHPRVFSQWTPEALVGMGIISNDMQSVSPNIKFEKDADAKESSLTDDTLISQPGLVQNAQEMIPPRDIQDAIVGSGLLTKGPSKVVNTKSSNSDSQDTLINEAPITASTKAKTKSYNSKEVLSMLNMLGYASIGEAEKAGWKPSDFGDYKNWSEINSDSKLGDNFTWNNAWNNRVSEIAAKAALGLGWNPALGTVPTRWYEPEAGSDVGWTESFGKKNLTKEELQDYAKRYPYTIGWALKEGLIKSPEGDNTISTEEVMNAMKQSKDWIDTEQWLSDRKNKEAYLGMAAAPDPENDVKFRDTWSKWGDFTKNDDGTWTYKLRDNLSEKDLADFDEKFNNTRNDANIGVMYNTMHNPGIDKRRYIIDDKGNASLATGDLSDYEQISTPYPFLYGDEPNDRNIELSFYRKKGANAGNGAGNTDGKAGSKKLQINGRNIVPLLRDERLRYAGLAGPLTALLMQGIGIGKPDYSGMDRAVAMSGDVGYFPSARYSDGYYEYKPLNPFLGDIAANNASAGVDRSISNMSAPYGNIQAARLANSYTDQMARADRIIKGKSYNDTERKTSLDEYKNTDQFNATAFNNMESIRAQIANGTRQRQAAMAMQAAQNKLEGDAGWYNSIYANVGNAFKGISDLGRENAEYNMLARLAATGALGEMSPENAMASGMFTYEDEEPASNRKRRLYRGLLMG